METKTKIILMYISITVLCWYMATGVTQALKCPELTQTQLILRTHHSIVLDFIECN